MLGLEQAPAPLYDAERLAKIHRDLVELGDDTRMTFLESSGQISDVAGREIARVALGHPVDFRVIGRVLAAMPANVLYLLQVAQEQKDELTELRSVLLEAEVELMTVKAEREQSLGDGRSEPWTLQLVANLLLAYFGQEAYRQPIAQYLQQKLVELEVAPPPDDPRLEEWARLRAALRDLIEAERSKPAAEVIEEQIQRTERELETDTQCPVRDFGGARCVRANGHGDDGIGAGHTVDPEMAGR